MTGYTVHTGSSEKFSEGWDRIFSDPAPQAKKKAGKGSTASKSAGTQARSGKSSKSKNST